MYYITSMVVHALGQKRLGELAGAIGSFDAKRDRRGRNLRDYQRDAIAEVGRFLKEGLESLRNGDTVSGAIVMPWGSGKTIVAAEIARRLGLRALMLSPTKEILRQNELELARWNPGISTSVYYSGEHDLSGQIIVTTYHSALSLLKRHALPEVDMVFYDEAHRSISELRQKLHGVAGPIEIGLTATPAFSEDRHIWQFFEKVIYEMSFEDAIKIKALAPLRAFMVETNVDVSRVTLKS